MNNIEPKFSHRFILKSIGINIPEFLFTKYEFYNDGEKLMFTTSFYETIDKTINPVDLFNISGFELEFLTLASDVSNGLKFDIKNILFNVHGKYSDNELLTYNIVCEVDKKKCNLIYFEK